MSLSFESAYNALDANPFEMLDVYQQQLEELDVQIDTEALSTVEQASLESFLKRMKQGRSNRKSRSQMAAKRRRDLTYKSFDEAKKVITQLRKTLESVDESTLSKQITVQGGYYIHVDGHLDGVMMDDKSPALASVMTNMINRLSDFTHDYVTDAIKAFNENIDGIASDIGEGRPIKAVLSQYARTISKKYKSFQNYDSFSKEMWRFDKVSIPGSFRLAVENIPDYYATAEGVKKSLIDLSFVDYTKMGSYSDKATIPTPTKDQLTTILNAAEMILEQMMTSRRLFESILSDLESFNDLTTHAFEMVIVNRVQVGTDYGSGVVVTSETEWETTYDVKGVIRHWAYPVMYALLTHANKTTYSYIDYIRRALNM